METKTKHPNDIFANEFWPECPHLAWLCHRLDGWQFGEQGLLAAILKATDAQGYCIEYGAGNGDTLPLTLDRIYRKRPADCILVEIDESSQGSLRAKYPQAEVFESIRWEKDFKESRIALVVIDIDGRDSEVMREMLAAGVQPSILMVEHMDRNYPLPSTSPDPLPSWALGLPLEHNYKLQDTAECLLRIAHDGGYERVGMTRCNSVFVRRELYAGLLRDIGKK